MPTRREFLQQAALLSSAAAWSGAFPAAIAKAMAIEPDAGSSFLDAEHVVILMQENRSFDHAFGTLQGVRGFNDPRAITLPNGNPVWVQTNARGESYAPFRLNIKDSNATWAGCLPHSRMDQVDARNGGRYDRWLTAKRSGEAKYAEMPLTLGYYTRADIPFYYALADAFTICDQNFCSALTSTTPNRLYLWTGTVREKPTSDSFARLSNDDTIYDSEGSWTTFPERLEDHGISWKVYQNELTLTSGLDEEQDAWLANYGDNPLEYFTQYQVRFAASHRRYLDEQAQNLRAEIRALQSRVATSSASPDVSLKHKLDKQTLSWRNIEQERMRWSAENYARLSPREKSLHERAFSINSADPNYRSLATHSYLESDVKRTVEVPKGDVLKSFRDDVRNGRLPTVSWLVAPERFSDHPSSAWYGAWYIAEALDILTQNPAVWKKTVFILTYDENDGYFDHVPPFVAPHPHNAKSGLVSAGIDTSVEYVERQQELPHRPAHQVRESPIGLGYRVPMIIASPWSRGGCVCSQVFDHTSVLQFVERLLSHKTGRKVEEPNISSWRRTVCGDLTSAFQAHNDAASGLPPVFDRDSFIENIDRAQFKDPPSGYKILAQDETDQIRRGNLVSSPLPRQEPGVRRSCPLPYELVADGRLNRDRSQFIVRFEANNQRFGDRAAGSPFVVYACTKRGDVEIRDYAVTAGSHLEDSWLLRDFETGDYRIQVYGPNGFYREFVGAADDPLVDVQLIHDAATSPNAAHGGIVSIKIANHDPQRACSIEVQDNAYRMSDLLRTVEPDGVAQLAIDTKPGLGWYDLTVRVVGNKTCQKRYAGRFETGQLGFSDPAMGRAVGQISALRAH
jgi:phospholipase C